MEYIKLYPPLIVFTAITILLMPEAIASEVITHKWLSPITWEIFKPWASTESCCSPKLRYVIKPYSEHDELDAWFIKTKYKKSNIQYPHLAIVQIKKSGHKGLENIPDKDAKCGQESINGIEMLAVKNWGKSKTPLDTQISGKKEFYEKMYNKMAKFTILAITLLTLPEVLSAKGSLGKTQLINLGGLIIRTTLCSLSMLWLFSWRQKKDIEELEEISKQRYTYCTEDDTLILNGLTESLKKATKQRGYDQMFVNEVQKDQESIAYYPLLS